MPAAGGEAVQITRNGGDVPQASPDGRLLYYLKDDSYPKSYSEWRMPVGGGEETKVLDSVHRAGHWAFGGQGIYFFAKPDEKGRSDIRFYEFATRRINKILTVEREIESWIAVSPDNRTILYTQLEAASDLMLVENFH
jgi:Tol biopolymer transport system component